MVSFSLGCEMRLSEQSSAGERRGEEEGKQRSARSLSPTAVSSSSTKFTFPPSISPSSPSSSHESKSKLLSFLSSTAAASSISLKLSRSHYGHARRHRSAGQADDPGLREAQRGEARGLARLRARGVPVRPLARGAAREGLGRGSADHAEQDEGDEAGVRGGQGVAEGGGSGAAMGLGLGLMVDFLEGMVKPMMVLAVVLMAVALSYAQRLRLEREMLYAIFRAFLQRRRQVGAEGRPC